MNILRLISSTAAIILALTTTTTFAAESKTNKSRLNDIADRTLAPLADMQACGQAFDSPYSDRAAKIESNLQELVGLMGFDVEAFWQPYKKKAGVYAMLTKVHYSTKGTSEVDMPDQVDIRRRSEEFRINCKQMHFLAAAAEDGLGEALRKVRPKSIRNTSTSGCPLSSDSYQERFRQSGKMSDLTCFQKAGRRELDAAQVD